MVHFLEHSEFYSVIFQMPSCSIVHPDSIIYHYLLIIYFIILVTQIKLWLSIFKENWLFERLKNILMIQSWWCHPPGLHFSSVCPHPLGWIWKVSHILHPHLLIQANFLSSPLPTLISSIWPPWSAVRCPCSSLEHYCIFLFLDLIIFCWIASLSTQCLAYRKLSANL